MITYHIQVLSNGVWKDYIPFGNMSLDFTQEALQRLRKKHHGQITFRIVERIISEEVNEDHRQQKTPAQVV